MKKLCFWWFRLMRIFAIRLPQRKLPQVSSRKLRR
jgi:hypothetical protein